MNWFMKPKTTWFKKAFLKFIVKPMVVNDRPYGKNSKTAQEFLITDAHDFEIEKERLINYIKKTQNLGEAHFDGKESHAFGKLNKTEWSNMFYKHLNHHLSQFGV